MSYYVDQLAMGLGTEVPPERTVIFVHALAGLNESQLAHGFAEAVKHFKPQFGRTFPAPAEILEWAEQWRPEEASSRRLLDRGDKPPDWPEDPAERQGVIDEGRDELDRLRSQVGELARQKSVPRPYLPSSEHDFEQRRQKQLREFRERNGIVHP